MREIINPVAVDSEKQLAAEVALYVAEHDLMMGQSLRVVWKDLEAKGKWGSFMPSRPNEIVVDPNQPLDEIIDTTLHEAYHAKQHADGEHVPAMFDPCDKSGTERAAVKYAREKTPVAKALVPFFVEKCAELQRAEERLGRLKADGCGCTREKSCGCDAPDVDTFAQTAHKLASVPYPFHNRVVPLKTLAAWSEAAMNDDQPAIKSMLDNPDSWVQTILEEREKYEQAICSRPEYSDTIPLCLARKERDQARRKSDPLEDLLTGIRLGREGGSDARLAS